MAKIKVLLVDDHKIIRDGILALLKSEKNIEVIKEASNGQEALGYALEYDLDLIIMDINMPEMNGIEATEAIKKAKPKCSILALSMHDEASYIEKMIKAGASGYILKNANRNELIEAINSIKTKGSYFSQAVSNKMMQRIIKEDEPAYGNISTREVEVLEMIAQGMTNKQIADDLLLSVRTVDSHRRNLLKKLDAKNSVDMVHRAYKTGVLS